MSDGRLVVPAIFAAGMREVLLALGIEGLGIQLGLGVLIGTLGPYILFVFARHIKMSKVLGF